MAVVSLTCLFDYWCDFVFMELFKVAATQFITAVIFVLEMRTHVTILNVHGSDSAGEVIPYPYFL